MATNIKKNTAKLMMQKLQSELDALFAEQQLLNGDSKGKPQGGLPKADGGIKIPKLPWENRNPYGQGYTNLGNYSFGNMFQDPYKADFGIPELTNNASWFQAPSAVYGSAQSKPAGTGVPTPVKTTTDSTSLKGSKPKGFVPNTASTSNLKVPTFGTGTNPLMNLKGDNFKLAPGPKSATPAEGIDWGKTGAFAGQIAPMLYNMFKGLQKPEKTTPNYNPYEDEIRSTMRNRRFNIDPTLNANRTAQAVSNRNISNVANSRGELMSNLGAAQNYRMAGDAAAYAQKNNMDNQYLGEQAQMDAQLGSQRAGMDWNVQTANSQNRAATNQFMSQGFNDLGRFAQTQQLMGNQQMRDAQLAGLYPDMFGVYNFMNGAKNIVNSTLTKPKKP